jgi:hypothetical protein
MGTKFKKLGSCGGRSCSATPGGYNQGAQIAAQGGHSGGGEGIQHTDLRGGKPASGEYKQAPTVTAAKK